MENKPCSPLFVNISLCPCFVPALNPWPAKMPAALQPCSGPKKISASYWRILAANSIVYAKAPLTKNCLMLFQALKPMPDESRPKAGFLSGNGSSPDNGREYQQAAPLQCLKSIADHCRRRMSPGQRIAQ